jgi:hypothetical protein
MFLRSHNAPLASSTPLGRARGDLPAPVRVGGRGKSGLEGHCVNPRPEPLNATLLGDKVAKVSKSGKVKRFKSIVNSLFKMS